MISGGDDRRAIDRRAFFVTSSLIPVTFPVVAALARAQEQRSAASALHAESAPEIIDTNVHLFRWPFRRLKYDETAALITKLRKHRIIQAWAGSFEAVLHKQLDEVNRRLAEECRMHGDGMLVPIGSVNPAWPDWEEDLQKCDEQYGMPAVRLYPAYHGYTFDHPEFVRMLGVTAQRGMLVQIVLRMEDERVHHPALNIPAVNPSTLVDACKEVPQASVQLINSAGPLLGKNVSSLINETQILFDIAAVEGNGGVGRLIGGTNPSYQGAIPVERLLFGSHAPFFPCESALLKLFESPLSLGQLQRIMNMNARQLIS